MYKIKGNINCVGRKVSGVISVTGIGILEIMDSEGELHYISDTRFKKLLKQNKIKEL